MKCNENEDTDKITKNCVSFDRRKTARIDSITTRMGQYQSMNDTTCIIDAFSNRPFDVIILYPTNVLNQPASFPSLTPADKDAVENRKKLLTNPQILALARGTCQYTIDTDACNSQVRYVLLQLLDDGTSRPMKYRSRMLNNFE